MSNRFGSFIVAFLIASAPLAPASRASRPAVADFPSLLDTARDDLLERALYRSPKRLVDSVAPSGAVSVNAEWEKGETRSWYIEQQRYGAELIQAGLVRKDETMVDNGERILNWGFARQGSDGDFPGTGDPFHSTSLFVEAAARAALLLREAGGSTAHRKTAAEYARHVRAAALWMVRPDVSATGRKHNEPYTHRRWLVAAALGEAADLTMDAHLTAAAATYAREGLALQRGEGINPEQGGYDMSYQALGVLFASRYSMACRDARLRGEVTEMCRRGLQWLAGRVNTDGTVRIEGSTRTGVERGRSGKVKSVDYNAMLQALVLGAAITGDRSLHGVAERIARQHGWAAATPAPDPRTANPLANAGDGPLPGILA